jgi:hypothetical protein
MGERNVVRTYADAVSRCSTRRACGYTTHWTIRKQGSAEGKYFSLTGEGTSAYAKQAVQAFGDPAYTLVTTQIPADMITPAMRATVDRGVPAVIVPDHLLPSLIPKIENLMFIP